jgi:predicted CxxxxCH...CXXCH cytochrome family protein
MSFALTDRPPSRADIDAITSGSKKLSDLLEEYLASPAHEARVKRHFNDMLGATPYLFLFDERFELVQDAAGEPYHMRGRAGCAAADASLVTPWFSDDSQLLVCRTSQSDAVIYQKDGRDMYCAFEEGLGDVRCGCGPNLILCLTAERTNELRREVQTEFARRAVFAYQNDWSWLELLGGEKFYGSRLLYWYYAIWQGVVTKFGNLTAPDVADIRSVSLQGELRNHFSRGHARAGVATAPAFLKQFNNFRSRIRGLSNALLCRDVDGALNTSGISTFMNPDFSTFDREHGDKEGCAACHFGMDNLGSTLFGWDDQGFYRYKWDTGQPLPMSRVGHVFGVDGAGESFLMEGFVERGPGFRDCMAKRAYEGFTGRDYSKIADSLKTQLLAADGPRDLLQTLVRSDALTSARIGAEETVSGGGGGNTLSFTSDVLPVINQSCSGSSCHSSGTALGSRYDFSVEATFRAVPAGRVSDGSMPPSGSGRSISAGDRAKLLEFLGE